MWFIGLVSILTKFSYYSPMLSIPRRLSLNALICGAFYMGSFEGHGLEKERFLRNTKPKPKP